MNPRDPAVAPEAARRVFEILIRIQCRSTAGGLLAERLLSDLERQTLGKPAGRFETEFPDGVDQEHPAVDDLLDYYRQRDGGQEGLVSAWLVDRIEDHLSRCRDCAELVLAIPVFFEDQALETAAVAAIDETREQPRAVSEGSLNLRIGDLHVNRPFLEFVDMADEDGDRSSFFLARSHFTRVPGEHYLWRVRPDALRWHLRESCAQLLDSESLLGDYETAYAAMDAAERAELNLIDRASGH